MSELFVSVEVQAPVHQVYTMFTHFNDFPKFMRFVKEVTYSDDKHSHWVVQLAGRHEWDALNEDWIEDRQVGWRSLNGLKNSGRVTFMETGPNLTQVSVFLTFQPPGGVTGKFGEFLVGDRLERELEEDLQRFARMVEEAPPGTLDPMSSHYLFHEKSAVAKGTTTERQNRSMSDDPMMTSEELEARRERQEQEKEARERAAMERETAMQHEAALLEQTKREREVALERQAELNREEEQQKQAQSEREAIEKRAAAEQLDSTQRTLGGRGAALPKTPFGDRDSRRERFPDYHRGPDAVSPKKAMEDGIEIEKTESPWRSAIRAEESPVEREDTTQQEQSDGGTAGGSS